jgi:hypothetical protein
MNRIAFAFFESFVEFLSILFSLTAHTNTELFKGFNAPSLPTMTPQYVASQMLSAIQQDKVIVHLPPQLSKAVALQVISLHTNYVPFIKCV